MHRAAALSEEVFQKENNSVLNCEFPTYLLTYITHKHEFYISLYKVTFRY